MHHLKYQKYTQWSLLTLLIIFNLLTITSCKKSLPPLITDTIALVYQNNIPYLINSNNETHSLARYDDVIHDFGDYLIVKKNDKYGYIKNSGEEMIAPTYDEAFLMKENKAVVRIENKYYIINEKGEFLYTFEDGISSSNYFSENCLIITKQQNDKMIEGYLQYNDETKSFSFLTDIIFACCKNFKDGYSVVGLYQNDTIKYTYLKSDGSYLCDNLFFDEAYSFNNGVGRIGLIESVTIDYITSKQMMYYFINENGLYLSSSTEPIHYPYALDYNDGIALVANYAFYESQKIYYKSFKMIDKNGYDFLEDPLYYENADNPSVFWPGRLIQVTQNEVTTHVFRTRNGSGNGSWCITYYHLGNNGIYSFRNANFTFSENDKLSWLLDLSLKLNKKATNTVLAESYAQNPYEMDEISKSSYYNVDIPITKVRIYGENKYGIVQILYNETTKKFETSYLIKPLYDMIFY